ncbi:MAG: response regulator, partial [Lentilitoribacter sp.]
MNDKQVKEILFVDDSDDEAFITRLILQREKVDLSIAHHTNYNSVCEYLKNIDQDYPVLAFIDHNMPIQNGIEMIEQLYIDFDNSKVIAGIFSGSQDPKDKQDARNAGAYFFINKPMNSDFLVEMCNMYPMYDFITDS